MIYIADANGRTDSAYHTLVTKIPTDKDIVMVSWVEGFQFNDALLNVKDYILVCYCEYGYDHDFTATGTHIWGCNSVKFSRYYKEDWIKFDDWVKKNPPSLMFKREFVKDDFAINYSHNIVTIKPIDYPATVEPFPVQSEEEFNSRPVSASYYFGRSHENRLLLHSDIWKGAVRYGYSVCDNPYQMVGNPSEGLGNFLQNESGKKYISMHLPHWFRLPINFILQLTGTAKIGIAPHGAGIKTFRAAEVSCNSVMLLWEDDLAWSYPWVHGVNCLRCKPGEEVETIERWVQDQRLYSIYCEGVKNWENYRVDNYIQNYILPKINNA